MKSAIFESINDRSNIANAYMRMVNEANEKLQNRYNDISALYEGNNYPLCIYGDDGDKVIDLTEIEVNYKDPSYYEKGLDDYYIALAFDKYGLDELYKKLIEHDSNLYIPPERAVSLENGFINTIGDVEHAIEEIGREWEEDLHKDHVEVAIPEWAAVYFENADASGLTEEEKKVADDYVAEIESDGYDLVYDGENLGFCQNPEFGLADDCVKYYLIKKNGTTSEQNESVDSPKEPNAKSVYNVLRGIDVNLASIASSMLSDGKSFKDVITWLADSVVSNGTTRGSDEARAAIKALRNEFGNYFVDESVENGWFDSYGNMIKDLPPECIEDCTVPGRDAYESCKYWVNELGFTNGLDIPLAKGYLKWTGGWDDDEIASLSDEETAIKILWILANDAKEGMDVLSIGDGGRFDDGSTAVTESRLRKRKVVLTNIKWPDGVDLPARGSMVVEVGEGEGVEKAIGRYYTEINGVAPVKFHVARDIDLGFVEVDDDKKAKGGKKNEMVSQTDLDKLKKKNPKLKDISEER